MSETKPRVGFVGVGRMGSNMALRLHELGYPIAAVFDGDLAAARACAAALCVEPSGSLADVTAASDVIVTVVSDDAAMDAIFALEGDSLLRGASGKTFLNCATVTPSVHVELEGRAEAAGGSSLEACMASSIPQARAGTLYLMIGGRRETYERMRPLLSDLAANLRYIGPAGQAASVKALVNMVMNINTAGLAEGLGLGEALGLDLTMLRDVFSATGAASRVLETDGEDMQTRSHDVYFSAAHAAKDSHIALALAREAGIVVPLAAATAAQYDRLVEAGFGALDKSAIAELTFGSRHARRFAQAPPERAPA
jgi:3-hydroxyisobutyrate dehydrogenase